MQAVIDKRLDLVAVLAFDPRVDLDTTIKYNRCDDRERSLEEMAARWLSSPFKHHQSFSYYDDLNLVLAR